MNKNKAITIGVLIVLVLVGVFAVANRNPQTVSIPQSEMAQDTSVDQFPEYDPETREITDPMIVSARSTVMSFMDNFIQSAPGESEPEAQQTAQQAAAALMSSSARQSAETETGVYNLAMFVGVQDVPDLGYEILSDNTMADEELGEYSSEMLVELRYTGSFTQREFILMQEEGQWVIDQILMVD